MFSLHTGQLCVPGSGILRNRVYIFYQQGESGLNVIIQDTKIHRRAQFEAVFDLLFKCIHAMAEEAGVKTDENGKVRTF